MLLRHTYFIAIAVAALVVFPLLVRAQGKKGIKPSIEKDNVDREGERKLTVYSSKDRIEELKSRLATIENKVDVEDILSGNDARAFVGDAEKGGGGCKVLQRDGKTRKAPSSATAIKSSFSKHLFVSKSDDRIAQTEKPILISFVLLDDSHAAIQAENKKWYYARPARLGWTIHADSVDLTPECVFVVEMNDDRITLRTRHGRYVGAVEDGTIVGDRTAVTASEKFALTSR